MREIKFRSWGPNTKYMWSLTRMVVGFKDGNFMCGRNNIDYLNTYLWLLTKATHVCNVIGNIYENPELVKGSNEKL